MSFKLAVIVNKDGSELGASETFLHAHINKMPCEVVYLVGNPGFRMVRHRGIEGARYLLSRSLVPLSTRWLSRRVFARSVADQDTKALARFFRREGVNAVLAEYGPTAVSVMQACSAADIPLVSQFHGYDAYRESLLVEIKDDYRKLFSLSSAVVGVSRDMCRRLQIMGANGEQLYHNACGADIPEVRSSVLEDSNWRFLMVGRLVEKKAPFVSLLAFAKLAAEEPNVSLEIIGDGPQKSACYQLSRALGIEKNVTFSGARDHSYVMNAMASVGCFIQHSVRAPDGDCEGTPVGVLEALGMGLPVVATRHGGILDIVEEGETGLLVDEYDAEAMFQAMLYITRSPEKSRLMGEKARESVLNNWTTDKSVGRLWDIIQRVST